MKHTIAHVTHEAVDKIGGIGTVLEGMITSPVYQRHANRSILVGPCSAQLEVDPAKRLGPNGTVIYSSVDNIDEMNLGAKLHPIEWAFNVSIIYGKRRLEVAGDRIGEAEVLLIDVFKTNPDRLSLFKLRLFETFGIDSQRYEKNWDYEEYVRLAEPAFYALMALLDDDELPCILFAHEFMGLPTAYKAILDGPSHFRTIFHAHECTTARHLVESHPGHDTAFYNIMARARTEGRFVEDVFGDLSHHFRHALVRLAHVCDGVIAVGDYTADELRFLHPSFDRHPIELVYNGVPARKVTLDEKNKSRAMLADYAEQLIDYRPDVLMTHVMRPVISKGLWRDVAVCHELDQRFEQTNQTGVLFVLTTAGGVRRPQDIRLMEKRYGWPRNHRIGYPDLVGPEVDYQAMFDTFNANHKRVQIILVNQFGWEQALIGKRLPEQMNIDDLRCAADVEFGMATYEPFGISPLEPLCAGAVCVISNVCGCAGFVNHVTAGDPTNNVLVADYTQLDEEKDMDELLRLGQAERNVIESHVAADIADQLVQRLATTDAQRKKIIASGQTLASAMGWDRVIEDKLLGVLNQVVETAAGAEECV